MFPFMAMLQFWRQVLGRPDCEFWNLTPKEFDAWAAPYLGANTYFRRTDLEELMLRYPDERNKNGR
jgi:uncharacterized phage protein (TIGR02216 family)